MCPNGIRYKLGCAVCVFTCLLARFSQANACVPSRTRLRTESGAVMPFIDASKCESYANEGRDLHITTNKDKYFCLNFMQML